MLMQIPGINKDPGRSLQKAPQKSVSTDPKHSEENHGFQSREPASSEAAL